MNILSIMKGMKILFDTKNSKSHTNENFETDKHRFIDTKENFNYIGDIDELIFPEDEPYYISER